MTFSPFGFWQSYRKLIVGSSVVVAPGCFFLWDRYEANRILKKYVSLSKSYGDAPLPHNQLPTKVTFLAESDDKEGLIKQRALFNEFIEPLLTSAGIDYDWIEASAKKHVQEFEKANPQRKLQNDKDIDNDDKLLKDGNYALKNSQEIPDFKDINSWRVSRWLDKELDEILAKKNSSNAMKDFGYLDSVKDFFGLKNKYTVETSKKEDGTISVDISEKEKVLLSLLPSSPGLHSFQQGILVMGEDEHYNSIFSSIYKIYKSRPDCWLLAFGQYPLRIGLVSSSCKRSLFSRMFCKRHLANSLVSQAFSIASDHYLQLDSSIEQSITGQSQTASTPSLSSSGTVLALHPIVTPNVASIL